MREDIYEKLISIARSQNLISYDDHIGTKTKKVFIGGEE